MQKVRYVGTFDRDDVGPLFGKSDPKYVFYSRTSTRDRKEGERQYREGIELTNAEAAELLTHPEYGRRFQLIAEDEVPGDALLAPEPQGTPETGYPVEPLVPAEAEAPKASRAKSPAKSDGE